VTDRRAAKSAIWSAANLIVNPGRGRAAAHGRTLAKRRFKISGTE